MKKNSSTSFIIGSLMLTATALGVSAIVGFTSNGSLPSLLGDLPGRVAGISTGSPSATTAPTTTIAPSPQPTKVMISAGQEQTYSSSELVEAFYDADLPNLTTLESAPSFVGNDTADDRMQVIAESRGYTLQQVVADESQLVSRGSLMLQPQVWEAWDLLQAKAKAEGVVLGVVSGYRSIGTQQILFNGRLSSQAKSFYDVTITIDAIVYGEADEAIRFTLQGTALPGYSKHQTGYALDITDVASGLAFTDFGKTAGYEWISKDNYSNLRAFGFLPSYPAGVEKLGPDPEPWELVWIGGSGEIRTLGQ